MIQTKYALSYNVENAAIDILKRIHDYDTITQLDHFVEWFNGVIDLKGRITMEEICKKKGFEPIDAFTRIGFNTKLSDANIYELFRTNGAKFYQILFPILKDLQ